MNLHRLSASAVIMALALAACSDRPAPVAPASTVLHAQLSQLQPNGRYLVVFTAEQVPADFTQRVASLGGAVEAALDGIGVAAVTGLGATGAAELATDGDIRAVEADVLLTQSGDIEAVDGGETASETIAPADATASPTAAQFYARQWNMRAVFADQAWAAGHLGSRDVVVAILDTGIDYLHPDLVGLVDLARSKSLVPEDNALIEARFPGRLPISDIRWHGTAVASIIGSNAKVVAGINRSVTLIAVKIWDRFGQGTFARWIEGIVYAADQGADVINISGVDTFDRSQNPGLVAVAERAVHYAFQKGALLVSITGNDATDLDHDGVTTRIPCQAAPAICGSATGPTGARGVNGPWDNVDAVAPYSSFGRSAVDVAAPGGAGEPGQFRRVWLPCTTTVTEFTVPPACRAGQPLAQGLGTSWAAAHISGMAALLVAQLGHANPALIRARILESADDLGEPGVDPYYGHGRINIARALGVIE
jgi:subtilisin family serine protease